MNLSTKGQRGEAGIKILFPGVACPCPMAICIKSLVYIKSLNHIYLDIVMSLIKIEGSFHLEPQWTRKINN